LLYRFIDDPPGFFCAVHKDPNAGHGKRLNAHAQAAEEQRETFGGEEVWIDGDQDKIATRQDRVAQQTE
jgi:hypothetical protein